MRAAVTLGLVVLLFLLTLSSLLFNSKWTYLDKSLFHWINSNDTVISIKFLTTKPTHLQVKKVILLWTPFFNSQEWERISLQKLNCSFSQCKITRDRNHFNYSDLVVFHWRDIKVHDLPPIHPPFQRWALFNLESPHHTPAAVLRALGDNINWTATYRTDSDVFVPYGKLVPKNTNEVIRDENCRNDQNISDNNLVVWLVSNCETTSNREKFVEQLKRFISVDVYGKCYGNICYPVNPRDECYKRLAQRYTFILSFENSICKDYATEKLYMALKMGLIPVVFGGANYSSFLPPNSYIDALNFSSPNNLANYLLTVSKSNKLVNSYQEWRKMFDVQPLSFRWFCDLCEKLSTERSERQSFHKFQELHRWWFDGAKCKKWVDNAIKLI
ncbi:alpha-(1,3)-fucosyltransferase 9-like [Limulus polyphemus]|uniref:Fucosyltransferase n=1 Tax=Limulus polyphemus TaxID=6850 RepID=A0ABM1BLB6_LIMPO|nr:alpha-(1,3)-fucosyltransferase 9-like [Limulus polyphemus]